MSNLYEIAVNQGRTNLEHVAEFNVGDLVMVTIKIIEDEKQRLQNFQGIVIKGSFLRSKLPKPGATFFVRRNINGYGVERIYPFYSLNLHQVKVITKHKIRQARIYYYRELFGKKARLKRIKG